MVPPYAQWRIALQIASQLPDDAGEALRVLQMAEKLIYFLREMEQPHHLTVVSFPTDEKSASP
jgi:hypothetical protein